MTKQHPIAPPPHLLKKFSAQAQAEANKRNGTGYLKTVATLCIEWFVNSQSTSNDRQIRSSEITPPPELVQKWWDNVPGTFTSLVDETELATQAARWGADQELEACCEWLRTTRRYSDQLGLTGFDGHDALRTARRPKPPSFKEQAFHELNDVYSRDKIDDSTYDTIRRALEALRND